VRSDAGPSHFEHVNVQSSCGERRRRRSVITQSQQLEAALVARKLQADCRQLAASQQKM
jgi:hypothetical protein